MEQPDESADFDWPTAVESVAHFMRATGFQDVQITSTGPRGVCIKAAATAAKVATPTKAVSTDDLRQLLRHTDSTPVKLAFSTTPFDNDARSFADEAGIALFTLDARLTPFAVNDLAELFLHGAIFGAARVIDEEVGGPGGGWQRWTRRAKALTTLFAVVLALAVGPFLYLVGRESIRRAGEQIDLSATGIARRRLLLTLLAGAGTLLLVAFVVEATFRTFGEFSVSPYPSLGAALGIIIAVLLLRLLDSAVRNRNFNHIPLPRILGGAAQPRRPR